MLPVLLLELGEVSELDKYGCWLNKKGVLPQHAENSLVRVGARISRSHQIRSDILIEDGKHPEWRAASA